jgi:hypothetical protein
MASRASSDVVVRFIGDTGNLDRGLNNLSGRFTAVTSSLQGIATAGAVVGAISFFKSAIQEAEEAERITRKTEAVLKSTGHAAGVTAEQIGDLAGKLSELAGVDDEVIQSGANVLATFTKIKNVTGDGNDIFSQAATAALDMSAALDKSGDSGAAYQENVIRLGKALNDPIAGLTALKKVGVSFTSQQKEQIEGFVEQGDIMSAQKVILAELKTEFGGMAEANATATGKAMVAWGNFAETVGSYVMPAVHAVGEWLNQTGIPKLEQIASVVADVAVPAFRTLAGVLGGLADVWGSLPGPIQASVIALGAWAFLGDKVTGVFGRMGGGMRGFGGDVRTAMGAFDVSRVQGALMSIEERVPVIGQMSTAFRDNASTSIALGGAWGGLQGRATQLGGVVRGSLAAAFTGLKSAGMGLMNVLGGPWGLVIAGGTALLGVFASASQKAAEEQQKAADAGKRLADAIAEQNGVLTKGIYRETATEIENLSGEIFSMADDLGISSSKIVDGILKQDGSYQQVIASLDKYIAQHQTYNAETGMVDGLDAEGQAALVAKESYQSLMLAKNEQGNASARAVAAADAAADASKIETDANLERYKSITDLKTATDQYNDAVKDLTGSLQAYWDQQQSQVEAAESWEASWDSLTESVTNNGTSLEITEQKGRANRDAIEQLVVASQAMMQQDIASQVPMDEVIRRHNDRMNAVIGEADKVGLDRAATQDLINTYGGVPDDVVTNIMQTGYNAVKDALFTLGAVQMLLRKGEDVTPANIAKQVSANKTYADNQAYFEGRGGKAFGGLIEGPGSGTSDTAGLFRLSNKEFVQRRAAVDYYGVPFMSALNSLAIPRQMIPGLATGGYVRHDAPFPVDVSKTWVPTQQQVVDAYFKANPGAARGPGGPGMGWQKMWETVRGQFGNATLNSAFRPGDPGYHGRGRAIDIGGPMMAINRWLAGAYPNATELIYTPGINLWHGRPHTYKAATRADHFDHVHWAMAKGGLVKTPMKLMDQGGVLDPGFNPVWNGTGAPEPLVRTNGADGGGVKLHPDTIKALGAVLEKNAGQPGKVVNVGGIHVENRPADVMQQLRFAEMMAGI